MNGRRFNKRNAWANGRDRRQFLPDITGPGSFLSPEEIVLICQDPMLRIKDHREIISVAQQLIVTPEDEYLQELFQLQTQQLRGEALQANDPFHPNYPPRGELAKVADMVPDMQMPNGEWIGPREDRLLSNTLTIGATNTGKSTLMRQRARHQAGRGHSVVIVDRKRESRHMATLPDLSGKAVPLDVSELKLALGQPPPGVPESQWGIRLCDVIGKSYQRFYAPRLLHKKFEELRLSRDGSGYISLGRLIYALEKFRPGWGRTEAQYRESMLGVLCDIENTFGSVFDYVESNFLEKLFDSARLVILELGNLSAEHYAFLVAFIATWLNMGRLNGTLPHAPTVCFFLDDATVAADAQRDKDTPGGISPLAELSFMGRGQKIGFFFSAHTISSVSEKIVSNTETKYLLVLSGEDPRRAQYLLGTTPEQTERLRMLRPGEAVGLIPSVWPQPVYGRFPQFTTPRMLTEDERKRLADTFLSKVTSVKAISLPVPEGTSPAVSQPQPATTQGVSLTPHETAFLLLVATQKPCPITDIYTQLNKSRPEGKKLAKSLESKGLVEFPSFSTRKRGGAVTLPVLTDAGTVEATKLGVNPPRPRTGGGNVHGMVARLVAERGKQLGMAVDYEFNVGAHRVDVVWRDRKTGKLTLFNIGITAADRELENACAIVNHSPAAFVFVARDMGLLRKFEYLLRARDRDGSLSQKIQMRIVTDFLDG